MTQAEACDKILRHLITAEKPLNADDIKSEVLTDQDPKRIQYLIDSISSYKSSPAIVEIYEYDRGGILPTFFTKDFLEIHGGFVADFRKRSDAQEQEDVRKKNEATKLKYEAVTAKWVYYTYWIAFFFSLAALFISIIALSMKS